METQTQAQSRGPIESKGTKFLAGVGIIALLGAAVWLGIQAVQFGSAVTSGLAGSLSGVRSLFGGRGELVLSADPGVVASEDPFILSWEQADEEEVGSYVFNYECTPGVHLESPLSNNNGNVVFCNTPFDFLNTDNKLELSAVTTNEGATDVVMQISFTPNESDESTMMGEASVTVVSDPSLVADIAGAATSTEPASTSTPPDTSATGGSGSPSTPPTPVTPVSGNPVVVTGNLNPVNDPNGTPDLTVRILAIGTLTSSGNFTPQTGKLDPDDRLAVRFEVVNEGTKDSGTWNFKADLPTERRYTYNSPDQETILPGTRIEFTLGFDDAEDDDATGRIEITIDPDDDVDEINEGNNRASRTINFQS